MPNIGVELFWSLWNLLSWFCPLLLTLKWSEVQRSEASKRSGPDKELTNRNWMARLLSWSNQNLPVVIGWQEQGDFQEGSEPLGCCPAGFRYTDLGLQSKAFRCTSIEQLRVKVLSWIPGDFALLGTSQDIEHMERFSSFSLTPIKPNRRQICAFCAYFPCCHFPQNHQKIILN